MKKLITTTLLVLFFGYVYAQKDITTFLGIPVDGTKAVMITKLKAKGFTYDKDIDALKGIFNGHESYVTIRTNRDNKVYIIIVMDAYPSSEVVVKNRYNNLIRQFSEKKDKYVADGSLYQTIPDDEDIAYEMNVRDKKYKTDFYQAPSDQDYLNKALKKKYTSEQLQNPTMDEKADIARFIEEEANKIYDEIISMKQVSIMIFENQGEYRITYFYENKNNNNESDDL